MKIDNSINYTHKLRNQYSTSATTKSTENTLISLNKIDISYFDQETINYNKLTKLTLENLSESYKDVSICIIKDTDNIDLKKLALELGNGKHLVVSQNFINKMSSSAEAYNKGKAILEETLKQLSNSNFDFKSIGAYVGEKGITFWSTYEKENPINTNQNNFFDAMKKMQEQMDNLKNKFKVINTNYALNEPIDVYSKLAKARSISEVKNVASTARFKINKLKAMLRDCDDEDKSKIKAAIRQLEKAITRSYRKVKDLSQEKNLSQEKIIAEINDKKKLVEHKKNELQRRKAVRYIREMAQMNEANPIYYYPQMFLNKKSNSPKDELVPIIDISSISSYSIPQEINVKADTVIDIMPTIEI